MTKDIAYIFQSLKAKACINITNIKMNKAANTWPNTIPPKIGFLITKTSRHL